MKSLAAAFALALFGCGGVEVLPGQREAEHLVWVETYGRTDPAPLIDWVDPEGCHTAGGVVKGNQCVAGWCELFPELAVVVRSEKFYRSALAHELQHKKQRRLGLPPDYQHTRPEWTTEVPLANTRLEERDW